jgi:dCTP deaminase
MVLTDREIQVALEQGQIVIAPPPTEDRFSSTSVDLTLSPQLRIWRTHTTPGVEPLTLSPGSPGYKHNPIAAAHTDAHTMDGTGYVLAPGGFLLGWTAETLRLPLHSRLAARIEGKSSLARCAITIHVTAPTIHAGFEGVIQLEICNIGPLHVRLLPGMPVCQLIFEQTLGTPEKGYRGQFAGQEAA